MSRALRILQVTPHYLPIVGGISNYVYNLSKHLLQQGKEVNVIVPKPLSHKIPTRGNGDYVFKISSIYLPGWSYHTLKTISFPIDLGKRISSLILVLQPDIVHVHGHHFPINWIALKSAQGHGVHTVLTMHGTYGLNPNVIGGRSSLEDLFNKVVFTRVLKMANGVIGLTKQITDYGRKYAHSSNLYYVIPTGVDTKVYEENRVRKAEYRRKYKIDEDSVVVLFVGRFEQMKGIIEFSKAVKAISQRLINKLEFVVVGTGSLEHQVYDILHNIKGVHLFNWQPAESIHEIYTLSDIFVLSSKYEGLPTTIVEAMNASLHIVHTPLAGMSELLGKYMQKTQLLNFSTGEIVRALTALIKSDSLGEYDHGSIEYARQFDWKNVTVKVIRAYEEVLENSR